MKLCLEWSIDNAKFASSEDLETLTPGEIVNVNKQIHSQWWVMIIAFATHRKTMLLVDEW